MEEHGIEKKANAGPSTQYLLLVSDEDRALLTVDQVLALYLIDFADRCKKTPPLATSESIEEQKQNVAESPQKGSSTSKAAAKAQLEQEPVTLERNNYHFYMTVCVFIQLYRSCLNDSIYQTFEGRTSLLAASEEEANFT